MHPLARVEQPTTHDLVRDDVLPVAARAKPPEGADLEHTIVSFEGVHHRASLGDETRHWLLTQHILARLCRSNGNERMPMRWSGDGDEVDVLALQHPPEIRVHLLVIRPAHKLHIAQGELLDVKPAAHTVIRPRPASAHADERPAKRLARRCLPGPAHHMPWHNLAGRRRGNSGG